MKRSVLVLLLLLVACHEKRTPARALPPAPPPAVKAEVAPEPDPAPPPMNLQPPPAPEAPPPAGAPEPSPMDQADLAFNAGNYTEAARLYENYVHHDKSGARKDEALFRMALSYALPANGNTDWTRVTTPLKQLVDQYPHSPWRAPASVILNLTADTQKRDQRIKQLTNELDKLKQIDLERRKRP